MPTSTTCMHGGQVTNVDRALVLRDAAGRGNILFLCVECGNEVRAHRASITECAHFEHQTQNASCSLSPGWPGNSPDFITEEESVEGMTNERRYLASIRNRTLAIERKQKDNFTCQACLVRHVINGQYIVDCHHRNPLKNGERITSIEELVTLCPTCHRIAHLREVPLDVRDIKEFLG